MRKSLCAMVALLVTAGFANASEDGRILKGKQLRAALSGKTVYMQTPIGAEVPVRYRPNGTIVGRTSKRLAMLGGEDVAKDRGRWWVRNRQVCQRWNNWSEGRAYCYRLRFNSNNYVYWTRSDGKSGTARVGN